MHKTVTLCVPCAEKMKSGYTVTRKVRSKDEKVSCALCGRRRYGATYEITRKGG